MREFKLTILGMPDMPAGAGTSCRPGQNLLAAVNASGRASLPAPCGGTGRCGKCRIKVISGETTPPAAEEIRLLGQADVRRGARLACLAFPLSDLVIEVPAEHGAVDNKTSLFDLAPTTDAWLVKHSLSLTRPSLEDQRADQERLLSENHGLEVPAQLLAGLPGLLRASDFSVSLAADGRTVLAIEAGHTASRFFGVAVDIGTTTTAAYLLDLASGANIDVVSALNAQKSHGADVISRIHHTMQHPDGLQTLRRLIIGQIMDLVDSLAARKRLQRREIYALSLAGNTTMLHLACGLPPAAIAAAPFIPVSTRALEYPAAGFGFDLAQGARVYVLPSVSAYVGADIVAAVSASGLLHRQGLSLLLDIGTNGEIVLGGPGGLVCCSTAAGPAFEGAHIRHGVGGIPGAINSAAFAGGHLCWTTIGSASPLGLCGSGIVDLLALLLEHGLVDETGRMLAPAEAAGLADCPPDLTSRLILDNDEPAFLVAGPAETGSKPLLLTQKDVREIQLAKAAIAAGIATLLARDGRSLDDVQTVYLAGGFGSYIRKESACAIGLLPRRLANRVRVIGNAAGHGAALYLVSRARRDECNDIPKVARYVELSSAAEFQEAYIDQMCFSKDG